MENAETVNPENIFKSKSQKKREEKQAKEKVRQKKYQAKLERRNRKVEEEIQEWRRSPDEKYYLAEERYIITRLKACQAEFKGSIQDHRRLTGLIKQSKARWDIAEVALNRITEEILNWELGVVVCESKDYIKEEEPVYLLPSVSAKFPYRVAKEGIAKFRMTKEQFEGCAIFGEAVDSADPGDYLRVMRLYFDKEVMMKTKIPKIAEEFRDNKRKEHQARVENEKKAVIFAEKQAVRKKEREEARKKEQENDQVEHS